MTWEMDLEGAMWRIGSERTKNGRAHEVPLARNPLWISAGNSGSTRWTSCVRLA